MEGQKQAAPSKDVNKKASEGPTPNADEKGIAKKEESALFSPDNEDGWQIRDTGEERLYWHLNEEWDPMKPKTLPECARDLPERERKALTNTIRGTCSDTFTWLPEGEEARLYLKVQLTQPCIVVGKKGTEEEAPSIAPKGTLVFVSVRHGLMDVYKEVLGSRYVLEVWFVGKSKQEVKGGRKVWRFGQAVRQTKTPRVQRAPEVQRDDGFDWASGEAGS